MVAVKGFSALGVLKLITGSSIFYWFVTAKGIGKTKRNYDFKKVKTMFRILLSLSLLCGVWSNPYSVVFSENSNYNDSSTTQGNTFDLAFSIEGVNDSFDLQLSKNPISES